MVAQTKNKIFFSLAIGVMFLTAVLFGPLFSLGMEMRENETMSGCLFTGEMEVCPMTVMEHVSAWQQLFISIPEKSNPLSLLLALLLMATVFFVYNQKWKREELLENFLVLRLYLTQQILSPIYDTLRELFSRGILNPKIY